MYHEQQKTAARDAMAPIYAAIDELPVSQQGTIRTILTNAYSDAKQHSVTGSENIVRNMQATLEGKGKEAWFGLSKTDAGIASDVIERAQAIAAARGNPDIFLKGTQLKAQQAEAAKAAATLLYGTKNTRYGQTVDISTPEQARNTARVVVLSATFGKGGHFNSARVNELLSDAPSPPYANGALRTLHDQMAAATNQDEKNSIQAVISVLTLENQFAADRAAGKKSWNIFANNNALMDFHRKSLTAAGSFAADDQTVAVAPVAGGQTNGGAGTPTRTGVPVYGRKDGTPAPSPDEVPALADEAQVRALQEKLGVKVDGMYGPETHAAMLAAAKKENKQAKDYDFTVEGALNAAYFTMLLLRRLSSCAMRVVIITTNLSHRA
jgi:peptidoglycan hydrolase-like protein with peptidoglycan-binding domain